MNKKQAPLMIFLMTSPSPTHTRAAPVMSSKTCFKCNMQKSHEAFYRHSEMADGRLNKCIDCTKADVAKHRAENLERIREYDRERSSQPHRIELRTNIHKRWKHEHPDRRKAQNSVSAALKRGMLIRPDACTCCGDTRAKLEAHHPDYSRALDVVWLCVPCHRQTHAMVIAEQLAA